ncbi:MAG: acyl-CoA dehydrogenase [Clostridium sp.]|nr:acyl-CoA dehydrogenase [Clostridium sp.]
MFDSLSEDKAKLREKFRKFVDNEIVPYAQKADEEEEYSKERINCVANQGYLGYTIPKNYGGIGADMITVGILNEEFGRGCSSMRSLLTVHGMVSIAISKWGTKEQKEKLLPRMAKGEIIGAFALTEPEAGSNAKGIKTTAVQDGDGYILNGKKKWITMGQVADMFLVFAKVEDKITSFLIDKETEGFSVKPIKGITGVRASMLAELTFENCRVPKENIVGRVGTGISHVALNCLDYGRYSIACGCVGIGQAALEESLAYSKEREQFGKKLMENQLIQEMIASMVVNVKAARLLCLNAGNLKDKGDPDSIMETWNAKYFASTMLGKITSDAVQIHGANGFLKGYSVERYYRDSKINEVIEGSTQIHESLIAKNAFRSF